MTVATLDTHSLAAEPSPATEAFLRFFGTVCAVPSVRMLGLTPGGAMIDLWVRLGPGEEHDQDAIYTAIQRYRAGEGLLEIDLHVIFADEEDDAFPTDATVVYSRE